MIGRHVGVPPKVRKGHQQSVSIQSPINLDETLFGANGCLALLAPIIIPGS